MDRIRLQQDDFTALRSLSQRMWRQGDTFGWRFNRTWHSVSFGEVPALEAADRLIAMGLAETTVCCADCRRPAFKLTARGIAMVGRINTTPRSEVAESPIAEPAKGLCARLRSLFA